MTKKITVTKARSDLSAVLNDVAHGQQRVKLIRRGKPVAVMISPEDNDFLEALEDDNDRRAIAHALKNPRRIPMEEVKRDLGL